MRINLKYQSSYKVLFIIRMIYNRYIISRVALLDNFAKCTNQTHQSVYDE